MSQAASDPEFQSLLHVSETVIPAPLPSPPSAAAPQQEGTPLLQALPTVQERLLQYIQERLQALEFQLTLEQQRQQDRLEKELEKLRQLLTSTTQEQWQRQHTIALRLNETLDELRKEVAEALQRLSQDVDHAFRNSDVQTRSALDKLRDELLVTFGKQLQAPPVKGEK